MTQVANESPPSVTALKFVRALASGDFDAAYSMLTPEMRSSLSRAALATRYQEMISYGDGPADHCEVMIVDDDTPSMHGADQAWVYVAICGPGFSEAVSVIVVGTETADLVRIADWGRP
jgi:hypothetical protein